MNSGFWTEKDWSEKGLKAEISYPEVAEQHSCFVFLGKASLPTLIPSPTESEIDTIGFSYTTCGLFQWCSLFRCG